MANSRKRISSKDNIGYKGEVQIKIAHGRRIVRSLRVNNAGALPLFQFITLCLAGDYVQEKAPKYIRVFDTLDNEITMRPVVSSSAPVYTNSETESSVTLSFVVPYSLLKKYVDIKSFKIYSTENFSDAHKSDYSAMISLDRAIDISSTSNLVVAWKMIVRNVATL